MGGDAAEPINKFLKQAVDDRLSWKRVFAGDLQYSLDLHDELYRRAEEAQQERGLDLFGGHRHQLAITLEACEWIVSPMG